VPRRFCRGRILSAYAKKVDDITSSTYVKKAEVVATLRSRELHGRADWVDRELPTFIDIFKNAALLRTLGIDAAAMSRDTRPGRGVASEHSS
jgi:hypothetical protein